MLKKPVASKMSEIEEQAALSNSTARLYWHVFQKGFQAGAVVGAGVVVPVLAFRRRQRRMQAANAAFLPTALHTVGKSAAYGAIGTCAQLKLLAGYHARRSVHRIADGRTKL